MFVSAIIIHNQIPVDYPEPSQTFEEQYRENQKSVSNYRRTVSKGNLSLLRLPFHKSALLFFRLSKIQSSPLHILTGGYERP